MALALVLMVSKANPKRADRRRGQRPSGLPTIAERALARWCRGQADHAAYSNQMQFRDLLSRLWPRRSSRRAPGKTGYDAASRLEERTQSHYRSVTESDARGRSTKAGHDGPPPPQQ